MTNSSKDCRTVGEETNEVGRSRKVTFFSISGYTFKLSRIGHVYSLELLEEDCNRPHNKNNHYQFTFNWMFHSL